jgi:hypothetical protein
MDIKQEQWLDRHYDPYSGELLGGNDDDFTDFNPWLI